MITAHLLVILPPRHRSLTLFGDVPYRVTRGLLLPPSLPFFLGSQSLCSLYPQSLLIVTASSYIRSNVFLAYISIFVPCHTCQRFHSLSPYCLHAIMAGQCLTFWCTNYAQISFNIAFCPSCSMQLTPVMPSYTAPRPIDTGVAYSSLIPSSSWGPNPKNNEQMGYISNNNDMCNPAVSEPRAIAGLMLLTAFAKAYPIPRSPDRNSFLDSQAPSTPSSNKGLGSHKEQQNIRKVRAWVDYSRPVPEKGAKETCSPACISCYNSSPVIASVHGG